METAFPYLIGVLSASIPWLTFAYWQQYHFTCKTLVEKELSFRAGFTHARNLMSGKPLDSEDVPCYGTDRAAGNIDEGGNHKMTTYIDTTQSAPAVDQQQDCSPLEWREITTGEKRSLLGYLRGKRDTTLYEIRLRPDRPDRGDLSGAFIPDEMDGTSPDLTNAPVAFLKCHALIALRMGYDDLREVWENDQIHP